MKEPDAKFKHASFEVTFRMPYETKMGESIAVLGSIEKLGLWKDIRYHLTWTEGHMWVSKEPLVVECCYFQYKYVLVEEDQLKAWERGIDRIADFEIEQDPTLREAAGLEKVNFFQSSTFGHQNGKNESVSLNDEWEILYLKFSIFTGENDDAKEMFLDLKMQQGDQLKKMSKIPRGKTGWMKSKYGKNVVPWECTI